MTDFDVTQIDSLEHDVTQGFENKIAKIDDTHFAVAYLDDSAALTVKIFSVDGSYNITEEDSHSVVTAGNSILDIVYLGNSKLAVAYPATDFDAQIETFSFDGSYVISDAGLLEHDTGNSFNFSLAKIDTTHFALAYSGNSDRGIVKTFSMDSDGTNIAQISSLQHDATTSTNSHSIVLVDSTHIMVAYSGSGNDGFIKTFSFDGSYDNLAELDSLEHDTNHGQNNSLIQIDATYYALAYTGRDSDGYISTFSINGSYVITEVDSLEHDTADATYNSLTLVNSTTVALAYDSGANDGRIKIFSFTSTGGSITEESSLVHDSTSASAEYNALVSLDSDHIALAYEGTDADGFIKTFSIELPAVGGDTGAFLNFM